MGIFEDLQAFKPANEQEAADRDLILSRLKTDPSVFDRTAVAHMACSIWTVDPTFTKTLLVYHNIYDSWSWIGCRPCRARAYQVRREQRREVGGARRCRGPVKRTLDSRAHLPQAHREDAPTGAAFRDVVNRRHLRKLAHPLSGRQAAATPYCRGYRHGGHRPNDDARPHQP